jgi:hypothetical protein
MVSIIFTYVSYILLSLVGSRKNILFRAAEYQSSASQHRLNQPPSQNAGLQAANAAQLKVKLSNLKKRVKGDTITMEATLFYFSKSGATAKKVKFGVSYTILTDIRSVIEGSAFTCPKEILRIGSCKISVRPCRKQT